MRAIILAGGLGTRLAPYTTVFPKPLMPVGDMPILELLLRQLHKSGLREVTLAVGHLASLIMAYFGDGKRFGLEIEYSLEEKPLGTAGPLRLVKPMDETVMVMNGDLLTDLDFNAMVAVHRSRSAAATIGLYARDVKVDLGVIRSDEDQRVTEYIEKPVYHYEVSMGIYVFEPDALELIPQKERFDLPDLIRLLVSRGDRVYGYKHEGYWLDIGRPDDYQRAQDDIEMLRSRIL